MTNQELRSLIENKIEDEQIPATMLKWAEENQGKQLRSNNVPDGMIVRRQHGMTQIMNKDWWKDGTPHSSYLIDHNETGVLVPTPEQLKGKNPANYAGLEERNASRRNLLADPDKVEKLNQSISGCLLAVKVYRAAFANLEKVAGYPNPEVYDIQKWAGMIEEK